MDEELSKKLAGLHAAVDALSVDLRAVGVGHPVLAGSVTLARGDVMKIKRELTVMERRGQEDYVQRARMREMRRRLDKGGEGDGC